MHPQTKTALRLKQSPRPSSSPGKSTAVSPGEEAFLFAVAEEEKPVSPGPTAPPGSTEEDGEKER